ncbi:hypothetical protein ES703_118518 [subsurface metagenome]
MPNQEFKKLKEALKKPATPEAMREAAQRLREYEAAKKGKGSKPTLVSLGYGKTYPHGIPREKIADEIERNPEFFELMKRIVTEE